MLENLIKPLFTDIKDFVIDTLFPVVCVWCEKEGEFLCVECQSKLKRTPFQECIICRRPSIMGKTHPSCQSTLSPDGLISLFDYHDKKLSKVIIQGKYYYIKNIYEFLGRLISTEIKKRGYSKIFSSNFTLVPIPLAPSRHKWRGFNQAEILCLSISKELNIPFANILIRQKSTKTQKDLKKSERLENVKGAFAINNFSVPIRGHNFIVVDDVITTGSTILEACKVLKRNGAAQVWCLTVAKD